MMTFIMPPGARRSCSLSQIAGAEDAGGGWLPQQLQAHKQQFAGELLAPINGMKKSHSHTQVQSAVSSGPAAEDDDDHSQSVASAPVNCQECSDADDADHNGQCSSPARRRQHNQTRAGAAAHAQLRPAVLRMQHSASSAALSCMSGASSPHARGPSGPGLLPHRSSCDLAGMVQRQGSGGLGGAGGREEQPAPVPGPAPGSHAQHAARRHAGAASSTAQTGLATVAEQGSSNNNTEEGGLLGPFSTLSAREWTSSLRALVKGGQGGAGAGAGAAPAAPEGRAPGQGAAPQQDADPDQSGEPGWFNMPEHHVHLAVQQLQLHSHHGQLQQQQQDHTYQHHTHAPHDAHGAQPHKQRHQGRPQQLQYQELQQGLSTSEDEPDGRHAPPRHNLHHLEEEGGEAIPCLCSPKSHFLGCPEGSGHGMHPAPPAAARYYVPAGQVGGALAASGSRGGSRGGSGGGAQQVAAVVAAPAVSVPIAVAGHRQHHFYFGSAQQQQQQQEPQHQHHHGQHHHSHGSQAQHAQQPAAPHEQHHPQHHPHSRHSHHRGTHTSDEQDAASSTSSVRDLWAAVHGMPPAEPAPHAAHAPAGPPAAAERGSQSGASGRASNGHRVSFCGSTSSGVPSQRPSGSGAPPPRSSYSGAPAPPQRASASGGSPGSAYGAQGHVSYDRPTGAPAQPAHVHHTHHAYDQPPAYTAYAQAHFQAHPQAHAAAAGAAAAGGPQGFYAELPAIRTGLAPVVPPSSSSNYSSAHSSPRRLAGHGVQPFHAAPSHLGPNAQHHAHGEGGGGAGRGGGGGGTADASPYAASGTGGHGGGANSGINDFFPRRQSSSLSHASHASHTCDPHAHHQHYGLQHQASSNSARSMQHSASQGHGHGGHGLGTPASQHNLQDDHAAHTHLYPRGNQHHQLPPALLALSYTTYGYRRAKSSLAALEASLGGSSDAGNTTDDSDSDDTEEATRRITQAFRTHTGMVQRGSKLGLLGADSAPATPLGVQGANAQDPWNTGAGGHAHQLLGEGGGEGSGDEASLARKRSSYHLTNSHAAVELFLRLNHARQTMDFAKRQATIFCTLDRAEMTVWEALHTLDELREYEAVLMAEAHDVQVISELSLLEHAFQTAELCRLHHPTLDWLHLVGLMHGLGKLLAHRKFGSQPQWAICGETYPLGCRYSPHILGHQYFTANPDRRRRCYNTATGIYAPGCGLQHAVMSWSAPEYLHVVLARNRTALPKEALFLVRHQKFLTLTQPHGCYTPLCSAEDLDMLPLLRSFQALAAYKPVALPEGFALAPEHRAAYYTSLIDKYIGCGQPERRLRW